MAELIFTNISGTTAELPVIGETTIYYAGDLGYLAQKDSDGNITKVGTQRLDEMLDVLFISPPVQSEILTFNQGLHLWENRSISYVSGSTQNYYTTDAYLVGNTIVFDRTDLLSAYTVSLAALVVADIYTTGATLTNDILTLSRNDGNTYNVDLSKYNYDSHTGDTTIHFTKSSINLSDLGSSAHTHTISEITDYTTPFDTYLTGGTYNAGNIYFSGHGNNFIVDVSSLLDDTNTYTTGATLNGDVIVFDRNDKLSAYTCDLSSIIGEADYLWSAGTGYGSIVQINGTDPNRATEPYSIAMGEGCWSTGPYAHCEGQGNVASGQASHAEGGGGEGYGTNVASGYYCHAEGAGTIASGIAAHAEGVGTFAIGDNSHAENGGELGGIFPFGVYARGRSTHAGGYNVLASGDTSFIHADTSLVYGNYAAILGGREDILTSTAIGSTITAASGLTGTLPWTLYTDNLKVTHSISATTFYGSGAGLTGVAGANYYTTGGTYSSGNLYFSGIGTNYIVNVSALLDDTNTYTTGSTLINDVLTLKRNDGVTYTTDLSKFNYNTHTGDTTIHFIKSSINLSDLSNTGHTHTLSQITDYVIPYDLYISGGTYNSGYIYFSGHGINFRVDLTSITGGTSTSTLWAAGSGTESVKLINTGFPNVASGNYSHAIGASTTASGGESHTEGYLTLATGTTAHAEGYTTKALGEMSHAEGNNTTARGSESHAEGQGSQAIGRMSHAEGQGSQATGQTAHAEGYNVMAGGATSHAEGEETKAYGITSHAEGYRTIALANYSHAEGYTTESQALYSHAEGNTTKAQGQYSHAEGTGTKSSGNGSHAEGFNSIASGTYSHAEGQSTTSQGQSAHAEGLSTVANQAAAHAEGSTTTAGAVYSHAEGDHSSTSAQAAHAEGYYTQATNLYAHSQNQSTQATGYGSHAEGYQTLASGHYSHAGGQSSTSAGVCSFVNSNSSTVTGRYGAILGGTNCTLSANATGSTITAASGLTGTLPWTLYTDNLKVTNSISATTYYGNGSGLTNIIGTTGDIGLAMSDETTSITTGIKYTMCMPYTMYLTGIRACLTTSGSTQSTIDIHQTGTTIFSTKITIDSNKQSSKSSVTQPVLSQTTLWEDSLITFEIDTAGTGAKGLKVFLIGYKI